MSLIRLQNCTKCGVNGSGSLDGQARRWVAVRWPQRKITHNWPDPSSCPVPSECRPNLIKVVNSTKVHVRGLHLVDSAYWTVHVLQSEDVTVEGLTIENDPEIANTDGIDADGSTNVRIRNCTIVTGDDAIVIKTTRPDAALRGLEVSNCTLQTKSAAVKVGSETRSNITDLSFFDIQILPSHRGIAFQLRDQGNVSNVAFCNISIVSQLYDASWWGAGEPVAITALPRHTQQPELGAIRNVSLCGISATSENGIFIAGSPNSLISDLRFQDVYVRMRNQTAWPGGLQDRRPGDQDVRASPAHAIFQEYISSVKYTNVQISWSKAREEWHSTFGGKPHTVRALAFSNFTVLEEAPGDEQRQYRNMATAAADGGAAAVSSQ